MKLCLLCFLLLALGADAQNLRGRVLSNGQPIPSVTISVLNGKYNTTSDSTGVYVMPAERLTNSRLHFSAVGYVHQTFSLKPINDSVLPDVILVPSSITLQEVVVSGTMKAISKLESPIPVEVYSPVLFKKNPSPNIFESLQMINGVQPQLNCNVCNTGDIHINGMEGPYTMILIDGMPIVSSLSTVYGLAGIPNSMVKRIEVVKGPASTLYGSEAVGGLINIITKDPLTSDKWKVDLSASSVGEYNGDLITKFGVGKSTAMVGVNYFNYWQKRDINNDNFTDVTLQNRVSVFNKWNLARKGNKLFSLALRYVYENRWGGQLQWNNKLRGSNSVYAESIFTNRFEAIGSYELGRNFFTDFSFNSHNQDSYYGVMPYMALQNVGFGQVRYNKLVGSHDLLAGVALRYSWYDDNSVATENTIGQNLPSVTYLPGVFLQDSWKLNQKWTLLSGLRYDYNNNHGSIFTPRVAVKFSPDKFNTLRISLGNGYRVVNLFTEDHAALTGAREVVIANALRPEQSWNANVNYARHIILANGFIAFDASAFYTYFTNKIVGDFKADPAKIIYDNLSGYAVSKGVTVNMDAALSYAFKLNAGITWMEVFQVEKDIAGRKNKVPQLFAPEFSGTFAASYSFSKAGLSFDWTGKVNGPMYLPVLPNDFRPNRSPLFCIMNLQVTKSLGNTEIYGGVKNLLDFIPKNPILHSDDPFNTPGGKYFDASGNPQPDTNPNGYTFDPSYNYAPIQGAKAFLGVRWTMK